MGEWADIVQGALVLLLQAAGLVLALYVRPWIKARVSAAQLEVAQELAGAAYALGETAYGALDGGEKMEQALVWMAARLKERGIVMGADEVRALVEDVWLVYNQDR